MEAQETSKPRWIGRKPRATENKSLSLTRQEVEQLKLIARDGNACKEAARIIRNYIIERANNGL